MIWRSACHTRPAIGSTNGFKASRSAFARNGVNFRAVLSAEDVDGMVEDVLARVLAKRDQIEAAGAGTA